MKQFSPFYPIALLSTCIISLGLFTGCGKKAAGPSQAMLAIRTLQTDSTNTMVYVQYRLLNSSIGYLYRKGSNNDTYSGLPQTSAEYSSPVGQYSFRVWCPQVVTQPAWLITPAPRGKTHTELLVNGQVKATLDLDASRPNFERDTCSRTVTVQVQ
jgi:hypothetical protein